MLESSNHCASFMDGTTGSSGLCGDSRASDSHWTVNLTPNCTTRLRVYCFQQ
jgi:hypothetical protein